jgi:hypothetical protein
VLGHPYIDVRATFNSFIPANLSDDLSSRLVELYLGFLAQHPERHDKVEFDIVITCLAFDHQQRLDTLRGSGFSDADLEALTEGLRNVTLQSIHSSKPDFTSLTAQRERTDKLIASSLPPLQKAFALLDDCRRLGTPVFANLARCGFVAVSLARSLERIAITTPADTEALLRSVETVSTQLQAGAFNGATGKQTFQQLVAEFGHLRPGTYDICSLN